MTLFIKIILSTTILGTLSYAIVGLLVRIFAKKINEVSKYFMLLLVLLTFLIPVSLILPQSYQANPSFKVDIETLNQPLNLSHESPTNDSPINVPSPEQTVVVPVNDTKPQISVVQIYAMIVLSLSTIFIVRYINFLRMIQRHRVELSESDKRKHQTFEDKYGNIVVVSDCLGPFTYGVIKRQIAIPLSLLNTKDAEVVLQHESVHYKRYDASLKLLVQVIHLFHFFNPVFLFFKKDLFNAMESSCDELVTKHMTFEEKKSYAYLLIDMIKHQEHDMNHMSLEFSSKQRKVMNRIEAFMNTKNNRKMITMGIVATCVVMLVVGGFWMNGLLAKTEDDANALASTNDVATTVVPEVEEPVVEPVSEPEPSPDTSSENDNQGVDESVSTQNEINETVVEQPQQEQSQQPTEAAKTLLFRSPTDGRMICGMDCYGGHQGSDFFSNNMMVYAVGHGTISTKAYDAGGWGHYIRIKHDGGFESLIAGLAEPSPLAVGSVVSEGEIIGAVPEAGSSASNLLTTAVHVELFLNAERVDFCDYGYCDY